MNFPSQMQPPQQSIILLCPRHQEYVKGICLFNGPCPERLICRACRKHHDKNHLNSYEEIEDLLEGNLVNDIIKDYDQILKRLDHQIITFQKENQQSVNQIDEMFAQMQEYIIKKLNETRNQLIGQINKKIQSQIDLKNTLTLQKHDIDSTYQIAQNSNFQPHYVIDNFVESVIKSQNTKTAIINDPNFYTQPGAGLSINLSPTAVNNLLQFVKTFQDKVCSDIIKSFSTPEKLAQPQPPLLQPQGNFMTSGSRLDGGMGLGGTGGLPGANLFRNITPQAGLPITKPTMTSGNVFPPFPFRGQGSLFREKGSVSGPGRSEMGEKGSAYSKRGSLGRQSAKMEEEKDMPTTSFRHQHTPHKLLEMFKMVDEEEKDGPDGQGPRRSSGKGSGRGRQSYGKGNHSLDARGNKSPVYQKRNKSEEQRVKGSDSVILRTTIDTEHRQIMFGGLAYVPNRELLITSGTDGWLEIWDAKGKEKKHRQRAHNNDIFKVKYIEEKDILVSTGADGSVNVWRFKKDRDVALEFVNSFKKHQGPVFALEYLPELNVMISGGEDEHLRVWRSENAEEVYALKTSGTKIGSLCLLKRINRVAAGFDRGHINVIEMNQKTRKVAYTIKAHNSYVLNLVSIEERNQLVSAADDGYVKVWKVLEKTHQLLVTMQEPRTTIRGLVVFAEKELIISNHDDKHLRLWKLSTGKNVKTYRDRSFGEGIVALKNRNEIATGSDRFVKLWSVY